MTKLLRAGMCTLLAGITLGACAMAPAPATPVHRGVLHLVGNAPFVQPVLEDASGRRWPLEGLTPDQAEALQNRKVEVEAGAGGGKNPLTGQPALRVRQIRPLD